MTVYQLAERDYKKAKANYKRSKLKKNIVQDELEHTKELVYLRKQIFDIVRGRVGNDRAENIP